MRLGRPSIFKGKDTKRGRVVGFLTPAGLKLFEGARRRAASLADLKPEQVSDGDTIEYLARGDAGTKLYLENVNK